VRAGTLAMRTAFTLFCACSRVSRFHSRLRLCPCIPSRRLGVTGGRRPDHHPGQLVPLALGVAAGVQFPDLVARVQPAMVKTAGVLLLLVFAVVILVGWRQIISIGVAGAVAACLLSGVALLGGTFWAGRLREQDTLAVASAHVIRTGDSRGVTQSRPLAYGHCHRCSDRGHPGGGFSLCGMAEEACGSSALPA